ncbi:MAG: phosphate starvation-inducible protein PhoH [Brevundimonas diminuta]|nr:MAG: phosphate starvation-inducible protein PhoH [Brevundimonas diminuta]
MARESEFLSLSDAALRAVIGPQSRHLALIEDAFKVLVETPGGGVSINGSTRDRAQARRVIEALSNRAEAGAEITEADVRTALGAAVTQPRAEPAGRSGGRSVPEGAALPVGRRGAIAPKTASQARYLEMLSRCELTFGVGPAGTGKTFLAAAYGASLLKRGQVGDLNEKVDPYLAPIWESLNDILGVDDVRRRREKGEIEAAPIAFMRGRTLSHAFIIVDEAQNTSRMQMKMVLTRLGEGARMVVTGDPSQVDLLNPRDSGLAHALRILKDVEGVGVQQFKSEDVVRHAMVERIVRAYDSDAARSRPFPDLEDDA